MNESPADMPQAPRPPPLVAPRTNIDFDGVLKMDQFDLANMLVQLRQSDPVLNATMEATAKRGKDPVSALLVAAILQTLRIIEMLAVAESLGAIRRAKDQP